MKIGELLRKVAELADDIGDNSDITIDQPKAPESKVVTDIELDDLETATMVPPLQQKHELLKKVSGTDNDVETFSDEDGGINQLRQMAGLPAAVMNLANDEAEEE